MTPIIGDLISSGVNLFKTYFPPDLTPEQAAKVEMGAQEFKKSITTSIIDYFKVEMASKSEIIKAEANSTHWIVSAWRPLTMLTFTAIVANNYIIYPYLSLFFADAPVLVIPPDMWDLLKIGLGGYVVGRSVEKSVAAYSGKGK